MIMTDNIRDIKDRYDVHCSLLTIVANNLNPVFDIMESQYMLCMYTSYVVRVKIQTQPNVLRPYSKKQNVLYTYIYIRPRITINMLETSVP